jgi:cyclic-di-GMP-binding protein
MAASCSFDVVSDFDYQEMVNTVDQVRREIKGRYDLKDTNTILDLTETQLVIQTNSEFTLDAVTLILQTKASKRNLSLKIFDYGKIEAAAGNRVRQVVTLRKGIETELGKKISKQIRDEFKKIQVSIQGDALRISGKSRDELQEVIQFLRQQDYPVALQFNNYR